MYIFNINGLTQNSLIKIFSDHKNEIDFNLNHTTAPIIFYNKKFIGGSNELISHVK